MNGPDIVDHPCSFWDQIPHVPIVFGDSMRNAQDISRHPTHTFLDAAADILEIHFILHGGEAVLTDDAVEFFLGELLDVGEEDEGLNERD